MNYEYPPITQHRPCQELGLGRLVSVDFLAWQMAMLNSVFTVELGYNTHGISKFIGDISDIHWLSVEYVGYLVPV